jgi:hypothetical protein
VVPAAERSGAEEREGGSGGPVIKTEVDRPLVRPTKPPAQDHI